jgi:hypothetical protein
VMRPVAAAAATVRAAMTEVGYFIDATGVHVYMQGPFR